MSELIGLSYNPWLKIAEVEEAKLYVFDEGEDYYKNMTTLYEVTDEFYDVWFDMIFHDIMLYKEFEEQVLLTGGVPF